MESLAGFRYAPGVVRGVSRYCLLFFLFYLSLSPVDGANLPQKKSLCIQVLKRVGAGAVTVLALMIGTSVYHNVKAASKGEEHIGMGIYLNMNQIYELIPMGLRKPALERRLTQSEQNALVYYLNDLLHGDYDFQDQAPRFFPDAREAITYFKRMSNHRGVCRHKAVVLAEILNHLGISSVVKVDAPLDDQWHAWVYVRDLNLKLDPVNGTAEQLVKGGPNFFSTVPYQLNRMIGGIVR